MKNIESNSIHLKDLSVDEIKNINGGMRIFMGAVAFAICIDVLLNPTAAWEAMKSGFNAGFNAL